MKNKNLQREISWLLKEKYSGQLTDKAIKDITRLKKGEPVDYVIGFTNFLGCRIDLSYKPLIPRIETEFWVKETLRRLTAPQGKSLGKPRVLDVFAGSGCIGLAILKNIKNVKVTFTDNDKNSILQIKKNCKVNKISKNNYKIIKSDIFKNFVKQKFDFILANPPYIPVKNKYKIQESTLSYEPSKALFGGQDGLFYIEKFLSQAKDYLTEKWHNLLGI